MAFDPQRAVDGRESPPGTLQRPADAPPPLGHVGDTAAVRALRGSPAADPARRLSLRARVRAWASKASGRADRHRVSQLAAATDAVATQCDALTDHVTALEAVVDDLAATLGSEVARLRAEVAHVRRLLDPPRHLPHDQPSPRLHE